MRQAHACLLRDLDCRRFGIVGVRPIRDGSRKRPGCGSGCPCRTSRSQRQGRAIATGAPLLPSQQTDFNIGSRATIKVYAQTESRSFKADRQAETEWAARCKPTVEEDGEGLPAAPNMKPEKDCDLSRFNTAGNGNKDPGPVEQRFRADPRFNSANPAEAILPIRRLG